MFSFYIVRLSEVAGDKRLWDIRIYFSTKEKIKSYFAGRVLSIRKTTRAKYMSAATIL